MYRYAIVQTRQVYWANQRSSTIEERRMTLSINKELVWPAGPIPPIPLSYRVDP